MSEGQKPTIIRYQLEHTPSPDDPEGAPRFYQALGTFVMAWGRLEAHFLACILDIIQTPSTRLDKLPYNMPEHIEVWNNAFSNSPNLKAHKDSALAFSKTLVALGNERNKVVHGGWERFNQTPLVSANVITIKRAKLKSYIEIGRFTVNTDQLLELAYEASEMNIELHKFKSILAAERGPPPLDTHKRG